jgi:hypothetical protein
MSNNVCNLKYFNESKLNQELNDYGRVNFNMMFDLHPTHKGKVQVFNKDNMDPKWKEEQCHRYHKSYLKTPTFDKTVNKSYMFSGENQEEIEKNLPEIFKPFLNFMKDQDENYNQVVINWYENENDFMPSHSDWTDGMVEGHKISVLTLNEVDNEERSIVILSKDGKTKQTIKLDHGQILTMYDGFQEQYRHGVPALSVNSNRNRRISISFRQFK